MTRINLEQVKAFLSVVRQGGIRKAAQEMHLTQPAITARIKNLEVSLAVKLFDRTTSGLQLTKKGELLLKYAEQFEYLSELVAEHVIDPNGIEGYLRLGVSETIAQCWLPDFVSKLHQHFPKLEVEINVDISINLREALLNREIDLAILLGPISDYSVNNIDLPEFDLAWYVSSSIPDQAKDPTTLFAMPIITYARNTRPYRELCAELFKRVGADVSLFPSSSLSACFRLVEVGLGVAALPKALGGAFVAAGKMCEFDPGWTPDPLRFSASYLGEPKSYMVETAAKLALAAAQEYDTDHNR